MGQRTAVGASTVTVPSLSTPETSNWCFLAVVTWPARQASGNDTAAGRTVTSTVPSP
ncbi:hypothetical protein [Streptomyces sp. NPDC058335]|uniref:hypothetical protein n=1 Tax=Streptomyces sp. NPDC058335 TaxID=3346451 RepID=UPI0036653162